MDQSIRRMDAAELQARADELGDLLHACVHAGASVGFILPFGRDAGAAFWRDRVAPGVASGGVRLLVAEDRGTIVGTVQLDHDTMPNQPHRAEVRKLLVHPDVRRQGIARRLMAALEDAARELERSLLTLDTRTGDFAEPLYASMGYEVSGVIPDYCLDPFTPRLDATTVMFKRLSAPHG